MTKEEYTKTLEKHMAKVAESKYDDYYAGCFDGLKKAIDLAEKLDEPKKVVVPQFVDDWIEEYSKDFAPLGIVHQILNRSLGKGIQKHWRNDEDNQKLLLNAIANGYEVEKQKKYRVKLPGLIGSNGQQYISKSADGKLFACARRDYLQQEFTNDELKQLPNWVQQLEFEEVEDE